MLKHYLISNLISHLLERNMYLTLGERKLLRILQWIFYMLDGLPVAKSNNKGNTKLKTLTKSPTGLTVSSTTKQHQREEWRNLYTAL